MNERIRVPEVRLIDEEGRQVGVVRTSEAIAMARQRDVDLVEVAAQASPPVARLMDFGRFKYEQSKKDREAKKHQVNMQLREVRMKPKIDDHDIDFKTRTAKKLLKQGDKVKVTVMFRGREITHPQIGKGLLDRVLKSLDEIAVIEKDAMLEGRHMTMILAPDKKKIAALARAQAAAAAASGKPVEEEEEDEAWRRPPPRPAWSVRTTRTKRRWMTRTRPMRPRPSPQENRRAQAQDPQGRRLALSRNWRRQDYAYVRQPQ
ncbi:MAG: translation initiation factor IF-3 [Thermoflexaceae bacterium]|nr:translation initiation factor IF-3 [Thermoflexaceae bacterium]